MYLHSPAHSYMQLIAHILHDRAYRISTVIQVYKNTDSYSAQQQECPLNRCNTRETIYTSSIYPVVGTGYSYNAKHFTIIPNKLKNSYLEQWVWSPGQSMQVCCSHCSTATVKLFLSLQPDCILCIYITLNKDFKHCCRPITLIFKTICNKYISKLFRKTTSFHITKLNIMKDLS